MPGLRVCWADRAHPRPCSARYHFAPPPFPLRVTGPGNSRVVAVLMSLLFCVSGIPALIYQLAWQRILALHSGVGIYSVAMIVSSFMAGLGIGSYVGGVLSSKLNSRTALRAFAVVELGIGLFGALSSHLYYDWAYGKIPWLFESPWRACTYHFAALLVPTFLMGMSLPLLVRAVVRDVETAGPLIGCLYGANVLGAAIGAASAPWLLIRLWGIRGAIHAGVGCNLFVGLVALAIGAFVARTRQPELGSELYSVPSQSRGGSERSVPFAFWVALYGLSGFIGLALEMLWFRVCDVATKSTAFTFGTVLAVYLFGLGTGSLAGILLLSKLRRPVRAFLLCQCLVLAWSAGTIWLIAETPTFVPGYRWLFDYCRGYNGMVLGQGSPWNLVKLYVLLPIALFGIPTFLMGLAFTFLQKGVHDDVQSCGSRVGLLQATNILGCVLGSLLTGLVLLNAFGTTGTMRGLLGVGVVLGVLGIRHCGLWSPFLLLTTVSVLLIVIFPDNQSFWLRLHGIDSASTPASSWTFVDEDATGVVVVAPEEQGNLRISVDGKGHSWLPFGSIHSLLGAVPAVIHSSPHDIAIIGLGSGDTAWAAGCRAETQSLTVFELCSPERRLLRRLAATGALPNLELFLRDPRVHITLADGRNSLAVGSTLFDLIEADASRPETAYGGNLYSIEFFQLCASRLRPNGIMCTWSPTPRTYATFCEVFPHVLEMNNAEFVLGSNDPLPVEFAQWETRVRSAEVSSYLGRQTTDGLVEYLKSARPADRKAVAWLEPNRDLFPRDEFKSGGGKKRAKLSVRAND